MKDRVRKQKQSHMRNISESFAWLIKERLVSIDNMTRAMQSEMATMGIPQAMIAEYLPSYFAQLKSEVVNEQQEKYDKQGA